MNSPISPLISVIIPSYNHARFIGRALQSVLDQTYTNWEAVVIDNHSQDNTDEVVRSAIDQRITLLKIHNNGVIGASRNMGIRAAKGKWIAFLDSDDWWTSDKLQICIERINDSVDLIYHDLETVADHPPFFRRKKLTYRQVKRPVLVDLLVNRNAIANSSVVVRRRLLDQIGGIDETPEINASVDYNTWLRIAQITDAFLYVPQILGSYLIHQENVSHRDMSISDTCAMAGFIESLSEEQRNSVNSTTAYMSGRFLYLNREYDRAADNLRYCLKSASSRIRLRAMYTLTLIIFRKILGSVGLSPPNIADRHRRD